MNEINKRIQTILHKFENSRENFCKTTGINSLELKQIFRKEKEITYSQIYMICKSYPQLNITWLITGEGKLINESKNIEYNEMFINVRITKNRKIPLKILRKNEYNYRQTGILLSKKVEYYQMKYNLPEERALSFAGYSLAKLIASNENINAFELYKSAYTKYLTMVSINNINLTVAFHFSYKYFCTNIATNLLN